MLSRQHHASGYGRLGSGDVGGAHFYLFAIDIELQGGAVMGT